MSSGGRNLPPGRLGSDQAFFSCAVATLAFSRHSLFRVDGAFGGVYLA